MSDKDYLSEIELRDLILIYSRENKMDLEQVVMTLCGLLIEIFDKQESGEYKFEMYIEKMKKVFGQIKATKTI